MDDTGRPGKNTERVLDGDTVSWAGVDRPQPAQVAGAPHSSRYTVLEQLGKGGMGVVYLAHDRELNRRVALKVLRPESRSEAADARLQREAQAMARLDHPNVVAVFDVGRLEEGQLFVAMELVDGLSLRKWLTDEERGVRAILRAFVDAGRGLAAAHEAGLVHRDFKPDNVLVGKDGGVRVADFGLARVAQANEGGAMQEPSDANLPPLPDSFIEPLTRTGALVGTPLYMAPEQLRGEPSDARSDQFGFCVALYEALYRERPFDAKTAPALLATITAGPRRPKSRKVPGRIFEALRRGLLADPAQRWPSMDELLLELERDPARARLRMAVATLAIALIASAGALGWKTSRERDQLCKGAERKLSAVWDPMRQQALRASFAATRLPYAASAADQTVRNLDAYASGFVSGHQEACEATQLRGEQSAAVEDLRMACLEARRQALSALVDELVKADAGVVDRAPRASQGLPELAACADVPALQAPAPMPPGAEVRARIAAIGKEVARAEAIRLTGRFKEGLPIAAAAVVEAQKTGYAPLLAEAEYGLGRLTEESGDSHGAEEHFHEALFTATRGHAEEVALRAATALAINVGRLQARVREGRLWARLAQSTLPRVGDGRHEQWLEQALGLLDYADGKFAEAGRHYQRALDLVVHLYGSSSLRSGDLLNSLGGVANALGRYDEAAALYARALKVFEIGYGPDSPRLGPAISNLATIPYARGRYAEAEQGFRRVLVLYEKSFKPNHPRIAGALMNLAEAVQQQGRIDEAVGLHRRAVALSVAAHGDQHAQTLRGRVNLAAALLARGEVAPARAEVQRALSVQRTEMGPEHPDVVRTLAVLGDVDRRDGRLEAAQADYERALLLAVKVLGAEHADTAGVHLAIAELLLDRRKLAAALESARTARAIYEKSLGKESPDALLAQGVAARALIAAGDPSGRDELDRAVKAWARLGFAGPRGEKLREALAKAQTASFRR